MSYSYKRGPRWATVNLGIFICMQCSGIHRSLGVHISKHVRTINDDGRSISRDLDGFPVTCSGSYEDNMVVVKQESQFAKANDCSFSRFSLQIEQGIPVLSRWLIFNRFKFTASKGVKLGPAFLLTRLNDIDGLKRCFEEWESSYSSYDIRLANVAISAYLKNDMIVEAESVLDEAIKRSEGPFFKAWDMFMMFFLKQHRVDSALKYMEAALGHPKSESVDKVLKYFEEEKNVDGAEELCKMLKKVNRLDSKAYDSLLRTYIAAGKPAPDMRMRIEADGIEANSEFENLLEMVCPK